jgi:hypothetical protein
MGPNGGRLALVAAPPGGTDLPKSITFHDFCELTQRQLAEIRLEKTDEEEQQQQQPVWKARDEEEEEEEDEEEDNECIPEEEEADQIMEADIEEEEEEEAGPSPAMPKMVPANAKNKWPRWHSMSADDRDEDLKKRPPLPPPTKKPNSSGSGGQRKRALNATFSAWLQLFLSKRRHRHNRYFGSASGPNNGGRPHHGLVMHQSCYDGLAGPNGGPLRSSVSLCESKNIYHFQNSQIHKILRISL